MLFKTNLFALVTERARAHSYLLTSQVQQLNIYVGCWNLAGTNLDFGCTTGSYGCRVFLILCSVFDCVLVISQCICKCSGY